MADITIFTRGDQETGMGHIVREMVLGRKLAERGHNITYVTYRSTPGLHRLQIEKGQWDFMLYQTPPSENKILRYIRTVQPDILIIDIEHGPSHGFLEETKKYANKIVVIGGVGFALTDQAAIDELVDLQIFQSVALNSWGQDGASYALPNALVGAEYIIIADKYREMREDYSGGSGVLISMGGSDPHDLSVPIYTALRKAFPNESITAVMGHSAKKYRHINFIESLSSLAPPMMTRRVLITALGMTVYEACCIGIPTVCTAWSLDHEETAEELANWDRIVYMGLWNKINYDELIGAVKRLLNDNNMWNRYHQQMRDLIDGRGADRVAEAICKLV